MPVIEIAAFASFFALVACWLFAPAGEPETLALPVPPSVAASEA